MLDVEKFVAGLHDYIGRALGPIVQRLEALEQRQPEKGEKGEKGDPGADGKDGRDGVDGKSVTLEDVRPMFESEFSKWALDFERRAQDVLQKAIDRMPAPKDGKDGRDAFQLEDIELSVADDDRTLTLAFVREGGRVERSIRLNHPIYRGIWKDGAYEKGDCVTFGGSLFIAKRDTCSKPETDDSWQLAVKRGRDGRDGQKGEKGERGERGPAAVPFTELKTAKIL